MNKEYKTIINLIRDLDIKNINDTDFNFDFFINLLIHHKIFMHYYDKIHSTLSSPELMVKIENIYNIFTFNRIKYVMFIKELVNCLRDEGEFYIYKGLPLEYILYGNKSKRQYNDVDILVNNYEDIEKFKKKIKLLFVYNDFSDYTDFLGEIKIGILYSGTNYTVEFKTRNHFLKIGKLKRTLRINYNGINIDTLSLEDTFLQLVVYYYEFTENIQMIYIAKKCKLQYALDFYVFIKKYKKEINWNFVKDKAQEKFLIHKIRTSIINIIKLFADDTLIEILNIFQIKLINYINSDILDVGRINWNVSVIDRFLFANEIITFFKRYSEGLFWLSEYNKNFYDNKVIESDIFKCIQFKVFYENSEIKFIFLNNIFSNEKFVIFINIYAYRKTGEYIAPYIPFCLRKNNGNLFISRVPPTCKSMFDLELEKKTNINTQKYIIVKETNNQLIIKIFLKQTPYEVDCNNFIGFNVVVYELNGNYIKKNWNLVSHHEQPIIFSVIKKTDV